MNLKGLEKITDPRWGDILVSLSILIFLFATFFWAFIPRPKEPVAFFCYVLIMLPIMITLLYRLHKIHLRNEK